MLKVKYSSQNDFSDYDIWAEEILNSGVTVCGFDTETTVSFNSSVDIQNKDTVGIVQICIRADSDGDILPLELEITETNIYTCYIFHIKKIWLKYRQLPKNLLKLFSSPDIIKTGAAINLDVKKLISSYSIEFRGVIDLQDLSICRGDFKYSLQDLSSKYLNLSKLNSKLGNYDNELTFDQINYAAYDSYLSLEICRKMLSLDKLIPLFYNPDKISITSEDAKNVFEFLKSKHSFVPSVEFDFEILYNTVKNSYTKWAKDKARDYLITSLKILANEKILLYNKATNCWTLYVNDKKSELNIKIDPLYEKKVYESCKKLITIHGVLKHKLINSLENSIPPDRSSVPQNKNDRINIYGNILDSLVSKGLLAVSNNGKIYLVTGKINN